MTSLLLKVYVLLVFFCSLMGSAQATIDEEDIDIVFGAGLGATFLAAFVVWAFFLCLICCSLETRTNIGCIFAFLIVSAGFIVVEIIISNSCDSPCENQIYVNLATPLHLVG